VLLARRVVQRLDLGASAEQAVAALVADVALLRAAAHRPGSLAEENVLQLAAHLGSSEQARALYVLTLASEDLDQRERSRLDTLLELVEAALAHPELTSRAASNTIEQRRNAAARLSDDPAVIARLAIAPRGYVLSQTPEALARQAALCEPLVSGHTVRASVLEEAAERWRIEIVAADRVGLLSCEAAALNELGFDIADAVVCVWPDGCALTSFGVARAEPPLALEVEERVQAALRHELSSLPIDDAVVTFDDAASPWHTICRVQAPDRHGLLHAITAAFAAAGTSVHSARVSTTGGAVSDSFELTDSTGAKLRDDLKERVVELIQNGVRPRKGRRFGVVKIAR
jgi:UTP:GlnB (protein PII) uridylyltransferase